MMFEQHHHFEKSCFVFKKLLNNHPYRVFALLLTCPKSLVSFTFSSLGPNAVIIFQGTKVRLIPKLLFRYVNTHM